MKVAKAPAEDYSAFEQLDGRHPWQESVPEGLILYPVRRLNGGKISYFNFALAEEMGLIPKGHPHRLNKNLTETLLNTFCLRIVNEYDQKHKTRISPEAMKPHGYMATRYLQLQHNDKSGRTSGDGRCIWNGIVKHQGTVWDVSSRGTGVTALAPGAVTAGEPLKSGNHDFGYGCGMAEIDELFGAAILAEIFHRNGIPTERVLAIVDLGKGVGIGVRAAQNLIRPAHLFMYLKQGKLEPLRRAADYLIQRQHTNRAWKISPTDKDRHTKMLFEMTHSFARFAATLDRDYIFAWLDWDGDNVLADAGIIDYGSVRQFGLRHDQYRYDDVERFSTNLNEQKIKTRQIVQTFAQMTDFLVTGEKKSWRTFSSAPCLKQFDRDFHFHCLQRFLYQVGFPEPLRRILMNRHRKEVDALYSVHCSLERVKTARKMRKVADGIHRPAILNMRVPLSMMPSYLEGLPYDLTPQVDAREFFGWIITSQGVSKDRRLTEKLRKKVLRWQSLYLRMIKSVCTPATWKKTIEVLKDRSQRINNEARITGNALIHLVDEILRYRRRGLSDAEIQMVIEDLIQAQTLNPDFAPHSSASPGLTNRMQPILRNFLSVVHGYREDI